MDINTSRISTCSACRNRARPMMHVGVFQIVVIGYIVSFVLAIQWVTLHTNYHALSTSPLPHSFSLSLSLSLSLTHTHTHTHTNTHNSSLPVYINSQKSNQFVVYVAYYIMPHNIDKPVKTCFPCWCNINVIALGWSNVNQIRSKIQLEKHINFLMGGGYFPTPNHSIDVLWPLLNTKDEISIVPRVCT